MNVEGVAVSDERPFLAMPHPGLYRVTHEIPFPGLNHVHTYLADGPRGGLVCIDTSLGYGDSLERLERSLELLGRTTSDLERIVLTHAHPDHIGLARTLQELSDAPVVCHPIVEQQVGRMQTPDHWQTVLDHYAEHGREPEEARRHFFAFGLPAVFEHVDEGSTVEFADSHWDVYWTPGHEWGHVAFFRQDDRALISGDTLLGSITPHVGYVLEPPDPLGMFLDSLDLLASLNPSIVLAGHGRAFARGAERARAIRWHHEQRLRRILEILARIGPAPGLEVSRRLFGRDLRFFAERLALAETIAHLEFLRLRGRLERDKRDAVWHYEVVGADPLGLHERPLVAGRRESP